MGQKATHLTTGTPEECTHEGWTIPVPPLNKWSKLGYEGWMESGASGGVGAGSLVCMQEALS